MSNVTGGLRLEVSSEAGRGDAAAKALPHLRAQRQDLEKRGGDLAVEKSRHHTRLVACAAAAGFAGLYSLWATVAGSPPVAAWAVPGVLAAGAATSSSLWRRTEWSRAREVEALHATMRSLGRRIDSAERTVRQ